MAIRPDNHIRTGVGIGNPGSRNSEQAYKDGVTNADYSIEYKGGQDTLNMTGILEDNLDAGYSSDTSKDFIKFKIHVIDPLNANNSDLLVFRAFLENVGDDYSANYNSYNYNGRAEKFYTYDSFNREISFKFKIVAQTRQEMKPLYQKLNYLVAQTAPEYSPQGRMRAKFNRLTIGDWCNEIPGFFTSVNLSWSNKYPWEINTENIGTTGTDNLIMSELPQMLDVSCNYIPIHDFAPENRRDAPFILPTRGLGGEGQNWISNA